jgi:hypothetical protein
MKYAVGMSSGGSFVKIDVGVLKLSGNDKRTEAQIGS